MRAGRCSLIASGSIHDQIETEWKGPGRDLSRESQNGWFNVLWQEHLIHVVLLTFNNGYYARHHWILADAKEVAEDFFRAVCSW